MEEEKKELSAKEATVAPKNNSFLAGRGGPAKAVRPITCIQPLSPRSFSAVSAPIFASEVSLVTRCCAKGERQRGSDDGRKAEKKARRSGDEEDSGKRARWRR